MGVRWKNYWHSDEMPHEIKMKISIKVVFTLAASRYQHILIQFLKRHSRRIRRGGLSCASISSVKIGNAFRCNGFIITSWYNYSNSLNMRVAYEKMEGVPVTLVHEIMHAWGAPLQVCGMMKFSDKNEGKRTENNIFAPFSQLTNHYIPSPHRVVTAAACRRGRCIILQNYRAPSNFRTQHGCP